MVARTGRDPVTGGPLQFRDSRYASNFYRLGNTGDHWTKVPRPKFMFYARFVRPEGAGLGKVGSPNYGDWRQGVSFQLKYIDRPKINLNLETLNQYDKKRVIQTGVDYSPITMRFHDSVDDAVLKMWMEYFSFYYGDVRSDKDFLSWRYDVTRSFQESRGGWGFEPTVARPDISSYFFSHLELYHLYGGCFNQIDFIHPKIEMFDHDSNDAAAGTEGAEITMQIRYEGIKYRHIGLSLSDPGLRLKTDIIDILQLEANSDFFEPQVGQGFHPRDSCDGDQVQSDVLQKYLAGTSAFGRPDAGETFINTGFNIGVTALGDILSGSSEADVLDRILGSATNSALGSFGNFNFGTGSQLVGTALNIARGGGSPGQLFTQSGQVFTRNLAQGGLSSIGSVIGPSAFSTIGGVNPSSFLGTPVLAFDKGISSSQFNTTTAFFQSKGASPALAKTVSAVVVREAQANNVSVVDLAKTGPTGGISLVDSSLATINKVRPPSAQQGTNTRSQVNAVLAAEARANLARSQGVPITGSVPAGAGSNPTENAIRAQVGDSWPEIIGT